MTLRPEHTPVHRNGDFTEIHTGPLTAREKRVLILGGAAVAIPHGDGLIFTDNQLRAGGAGLTEIEWQQLAEQGAIDAHVIPLDKPIESADIIERRNAV